MAAILDKGQFRPLFWIFSVMSDTTEFCVFDLPVVYVYGSFPFDLDAIGIVFSPYQFYFRFKMAARGGGRRGN